MVARKMFEKGQTLSKDMMMSLGNIKHKYFYVYEIYNTKTKYIYVGSTRNLVQRLAGHRSTNSRCPKWGHADDWTVTVLEVVELKKATRASSVPSVEDMEFHYIDLYYRKHGKKCLNRIRRKYASV